jgi:serine protease Do
MVRKGFIAGLSIVLAAAAGAGLGFYFNTEGAGVEGAAAQNPEAADEREGIVDGAGRYWSEILPVAYAAESLNRTQNDIAASRQNAITRTVERVSPAVVGINVIEIRETVYRDPFREFFGDDPFFGPFFRDRFRDRTRRQEVRGLGSGFIISPDGYILTNDHVAGNAKEITVTLSDGRQFSADLVGSDLVSDIALLRIESDTELPFVPLGDSDDVLIGEWVVTLGNPFGLFERGHKPIVTVGVISARNMNLSSVNNRVYRGMLQTDAAINSGNSGGPLVNSLGEVIGVNTLIYTGTGYNTGNVGVGFAIPINRVKSVVAELRQHGKVDRSFWTGMRIQAVDRNFAQAMGLPRAEGVIVNQVMHDSPADRAGLEVGDVIVEVNGERITAQEILVDIVNSSRVGDVLRLKVLRDESELNINLELESRQT